MEGAPLPNEYSITYKSNKSNQYKIKFICIDNYLLIQSNKESKDNKIYENKIQLKDIKLNKYFSICDSIYDVLFSLKQNLSNNVSLEELNEELKLTIPLNHPLAKEITFNLKEKKNENQDDLIQNLYKIVNSLSQKVESQQKEIDSLKKRVNDLENFNQNHNQIDEIKTKKQENNINNQHNYNNNNIKNNNYYDNSHFEKAYYFNKTEFSYIIKNKVEELSIKNWIHGNKPIKFKLLFRMSRDGTTAINFHARCDSKGKTLILIETKDGKRIGGYTSLQWNMDEEKKYGGNLFIFNLEGNMLSHPLIKQSGKGAIICNMNYGPSFDEGIIFKNNDLTNGYIECQWLINIAKFTNKQIQVKELEVFQVNIKYN